MVDGNPSRVNLGYTTVQGARHVRLQPRFAIQLIAGSGLAAAVRQPVAIRLQRLLDHSHVTVERVVPRGLARTSLSQFAIDAGDQVIAGQKPLVPKDSQQTSPASSCPVTVNCVFKQCL